MLLGEKYFTANDVTEFATRATEKIAEFYEKGRIPCGYLTIRSATDGRVLLIVQIGECPTEKFAGYLRNSMEKGERIFANPGHISSWVTRNPDQKQYGGAIRTKDYIFSLSGLPEFADEALCVAAAGNFGCIQQSEIDAIFQQSENKDGRTALLLVW
jgi:hypothetical protein